MRTLGGNGLKGETRKEVFNAKLSMNFLEVSFMPSIIK